MADILIMAVVLGYCGLVLYWKKKGVLGDSCGGSCGSGGCSGCGGSCSSCGGACHSHTPKTLHKTMHKTMRKI